MPKQRMIRLGGRHGWLQSPLGARYNIVFVFFIKRFNYEPPRYNLIRTPTHYTWKLRKQLSFLDLLANSPMIGLIKYQKQRSACFQRSILIRMCHWIGVEGIININCLPWKSYLKFSRNVEWSMNLFSNIINICFDLIVHQGTKNPLVRS